MKERSELLKKILDRLAQNYQKSYTLEELFKIIYYDSDIEFRKSYGSIFTEAENHAKILEVLLFLSDINLIYLDPETDKSSFKRFLLN